MEQREYKKDHRWIKAPAEYFNKNRAVLREMMASKEQVSNGIYIDDNGVERPISCVKVGGYPTWFIEGHPLATFYEYTEYRIMIQVKMGAGGDWCVTGERRREYETFVLDLCKALECQFGVPMPDDTASYTTYVGSVQYGPHPHNIAK